MNKMKKLVLWSLVFVAAILNNACFSSNEDANETSAKYALVVDNGSLTVAPGETPKYSAHLVDASGKIIPAENVSWTVENEDVVSFSANGSIEVKGSGITTITASVTLDGENYTSRVPIQVGIPSIFLVNPAGIVGVAGEEIPIATLALSPTEFQYEYSSANSAVATVDSRGLVTLSGAGETVVTVTAKTSSGDVPWQVPVLVLGEISLPLPVTRIEIEATEVLFKGDEVNLKANAFNSSGTTSADFVWISEDPAIASVNASGHLVALKVGETRITAASFGVTGALDLVVYPDTAVVVSPFTKTAKAGEAVQFSAKVYLAKTWTEITEITAFDWMVLDGSEFVPMLKLGDVDATGKVTLSQSAMPGMMAPVIAMLPGSETVGGAALLMMDVGFGFDPGNPGEFPVDSGADPSDPGIDPTDTTAACDPLDFNCDPLGF